jgi:hypothetical protein
VAGFFFPIVFQDEEEEEREDEIFPSVPDRVPEFPGFEDRGFS